MQEVLYTKDRSTCAGDVHPVWCSLGPWVSQKCWCQRVMGVPGLAEQVAAQGAQ